MKYLVLILVLISLATQAQAFLLDLNSGIMQGSTSHNTDQSSSRSFNSLGLFANLGKSESPTGILLGWYVLSLSNTDKFPATVDQTLSSTDMGPAVRWQIDKHQIFSLTYAYGIICKGKYKDATTDESLTGESHFIKLAAEPEIAEHIFLGAAINYYTSNYKTSLVNSVQTNVSYKNTWIYPSISFSFRY
jgi:hypothetical protein